MNIRYLLLSIVALSLGIVLIFLPEKKYTRELTPEKLMLAINDNSRFMSTDYVAHMIIESNPSLVLIDVRDSTSFSQFSLPGATNIPLDSLLNSEWEGFLDQDYVKKVFYSNGSVYAAQAWTVTRRLGYENVYVLKGGINSWVETILRPLEPASTASSEEFDLYHTRIATSQFFGGGNAAVVSTDSKPAKKIIKKKSKSALQGGC